MAKPNIVLYFTDQQRPDTIGCYGQPLPITPCLDQLAQEGVRFKWAFTAQPVCGPARAMLQTGRYPTEIGCWRNNQALPQNIPTLAGYLEHAGYRLGYVGKWHLASEGPLEQDPVVDYRHRGIPLQRRGGYNGYWRTADTLEFTSHGYGGRVWDENENACDFQGYRADAITDFALDFLDMQTEATPFFLTISHLEPHHQNDHGHYEGPLGCQERLSNCPIPEDLAGLSGDYIQEYPDYLGCCARLDENLGRVIKRLKERNLYSNTVILYVSDHGSHFRTRNNDEHRNGYDDYKRSCHDSCLRVPLIMAGPGFPKGTVIHDLVSTISLPKTILSLAGVQVGNRMQGEDLCLLAKGQPVERKNEIFAQISESRIGRCIRTPDYLYSVYAPGINGGAQPGSSFYLPDFLYDLKQDPLQRHNLADLPEYAYLRRELGEKLLAWMRQAGEPEAVIGEPVLG